MIMVSSAVVGAEDVLVVVKGQQEFVGFAFKQVDQDDMKGEIGKVFDSVAADIGRLQVVERRASWWVISAMANEGLACQSPWPL